jgi:hypothetical protein
MTAGLRALPCAAGAALFLAAAAAAQSPRTGADTFPVVTLPGTELRHMRAEVRAGEPITAGRPSRPRTDERQKSDSTARIHGPT